jgi:phage shock protein PspC (stress-responsive transcriptional regulator)
VFSGAAVPPLLVLLALTAHNARERTALSYLDLLNGGASRVIASDSRLKGSVRAFQASVATCGLACFAWLGAVAMWVSASSGMYALISVAAFAVGLTLVHRWVQRGSTVSKLWRVVSVVWLATLVIGGVVMWIILPSESGGFWGFSIAWYVVLQLCLTSYG